MWYNEGVRKSLSWKDKLVVAGILAIFAGFIFYIDWIWDTQSQNSALSQISLFVAIIVAIVALWSLKVTRDSLELTRAATRPFLNVTSIVYQPPRTVEIIFCNTGALPADSNIFEAIFSQTNDFSEPDDFNKLSVPAIHESPPIFPGEKQQWDLFLTQDRAEYVNSGKEMYLKIDIKYIYNGIEEGITSRVSYLPKSDKERGRTPFSILSEGSYWK